MKENYEWVLRCIGSCKNHWQLKTAFKMVELFRESFGKEESKECYENLLQALVDKQAILEV